MNTELNVTVSRNWLLGVGSAVAVVALVVGLWVGINLGASGQTSVVAASYDTGSLVSSHTATDGYGSVIGAACSSKGLE